MRIVWIGNHDEGVLALKEVIKINGIEAFITLDDESFSKRSAGSREYIRICEENGISVHLVDSIKGEAAYNAIKKYAPDLVVVLGWSEIIPKRILQIPTIGTVGAHASLLPHNRGSAPINWALIHGEKITGNTLMWLNEDVDTGDIIDQMTIPISKFDTCKTLYRDVAKSNSEMISRLILSLKSGVKPQGKIQNSLTANVLPRRHPEDGLINWDSNALNIYNFIRALTKPYPGAFSFLNGKKYIIWCASLLPVKAEQAPGVIVGQGFGFGDMCSGVCVSTKDYLLWITLIEDANGNEYSGRLLYELNLNGRFADE